MRPSKFHRNRGWYNWLIYDIGDKFLKKYSKYYRGHLVDLGCGEAPYKKYFLQFAERYTGVDWKNTLYKSAADVWSNLNEKIDLPDESADTVIALSVMEHLCEPQTFLNESYRILKKGGYMIIHVPFQWWIHDAPYDYFRYTPYALKYMLGKAGFTDVVIEPTAGFFSTLILKMNYFSLRFIRGPKIFRSILKTILIPFCTLGQVLAPHLDKLDGNWALEAPGFSVVAKKA